MMGGEFEFIFEDSVSDEIKTTESGFFYSSGRAALFHCIKHALKKGDYKQILLPDYLCESIIDTVALFDIPLVYYSIQEDLKVDALRFDDFYQSSSIVLFINYFGCVDQSSFYAQLRTLDPYVCIIEDNVQAPYAMFEDRKADYWFTSLRKAFPMPDGGWVKSKYNDLDLVSGQNHFVPYKIAGSVMKHERNRLYDMKDSFYLSLFEQGEKWIEKDLDSSMSVFSKQVFQLMDWKAIASKRRTNASFVFSALAEYESIFIGKEKKGIPLFLPIQLKHRDKVRKALFAADIFCPVHWPVRKKERSLLVQGVEMSKCELSLIIDQRYKQEDLEKMIQVIKKNING